jgi:hypothetical protein
MAFLPDRFRRAFGRAAPSRRAPPDWSRIEGYAELRRRIRETEFADHETFAAGPLARFLELVEAMPGRAGARAMEYLRASVREFVEREAAAGRPTAELEAGIDAAVRARFSSGTDNDRYMIEVFEGRATHNYRAGDEEEDE